MNGGAKQPEIDTDAVCSIVIKARQFAVKEDVVQAVPGSNPADDQFHHVLSERSDDPGYEELKAFIEGLEPRTQSELVALMWIGRGDFLPEEWEQALDLAREQHSRRTTDYLLGQPLVANFLEEGLALFGYSCEGVELDRLQREGLAKMARSGAQAAIEAGDRDPAAGIERLPVAVVVAKVVAIGGERPAFSVAATTAPTSL